MQIARLAIVGAAALSFAGTKQFGATVGIGLSWWYSDDLCHSKNRFPEIAKT